MTRSSGLIRETEGRMELKKGGLAVFAISPSQRLNLAISPWSTTLYSTFVASIAHYQPKSTLILCRDNHQCWILSHKSTLIQWWDETVTRAHQDWLGLHLLSQFELIGNFAGDILEGDGRARYPLEAHAIEWKAGQLAHLHLPLDQVVLASIAMDTEQQEAFALLVIAAVGVQNLSNFPHHLSRLHGGGGLHAPGETKWAGLGVPSTVLLSITGCSPKTVEEDRR